MKRLLTALIGLCALAVPATAQEVQISLSPDKAAGRAYSYWTVFEHTRFGYELPVPPGVRATGNPVNGAESTFVSMDGAFKMTAWGGLSPEPAAIVVESEWKRAQQRAGRTISYGRKGPAGFVMSGLKDARTRFYKKMIVQGDQIAAVTVTLPEARAREFAHWVSEISNGFTLIDDPEAAVPEIAAHALTNSPGVGHDAMLEVPDPLTLEEWRHADLLRGAPFRVEAPPSAGSRAAGREDATSVDVTPPERLPATGFRNETPPDETEARSSRGTPPPPRRSPAPAAAQLPTGEPVPGKKGFVYSPYLDEKKLVDAVDIPSGTKVKCPYTGKVFRLP